MLRRPAAATAGIAVVAGGVLGVLALAMAGPFLRLPNGPGAHRVPWAWLLLSAIGGAGFFTAAMLAGVLAQPWPRWRVRLRAAGAAVGVAATVGAVAGERWDVVSRAITDGFAGLDTGSFGLIAVVASGRRGRRCAAGAADAAALSGRRGAGRVGAGRDRAAGRGVPQRAAADLDRRGQPLARAAAGLAALAAAALAWRAAAGAGLGAGLGGLAAAGAAVPRCWPRWRSAPWPPRWPGRLLPGARTAGSRRRCCWPGRWRRGPRAPLPPGATPTIRRCGGCSAWTRKPPWPPAPCCPRCSAPRGWPSRWRCSR